MRYIWQNIQTILTTYNGSTPLTHFLKHYYKLNPKLGSRDRKILSEMAYSWYRCEKGIAGDMPFEEKMKICLYLCGGRQKQILPFLPQEWLEAKQEDSMQRIAYIQSLGLSFNIEQLFPYDIAFSSGITREEWLASMLTQPLLFIRIRKNREKILSVLKEHEILFESINDKCLALPNGTSIDKLLTEEDYVIQDRSSQETGAYFKPSAGEKWYDACSGAGGKSLLLKDMEPAVKLTVSDKRESILHNLKERFKAYRHNLPHTILVDASDKKQLAPVMAYQQFDNIICDVPCTGSGTWGRTPEQLYFFNPEAVPAISTLQKQIAGNVAGYLKKGGSLFYITCSVFEEENEQVVNTVLKQTGLKIEHQELINGISKHADSMFITVLKK